MEGTAFAIPEPEARTLVLADQIGSETAKLKLEQVPTYQMSLNGVLIVDKPAGLTSHDVVNRVRRILRTRAVGHLGTLDPMATGVLPLVVGNLTRLAQFYTSAEKGYEGIIRFGFATDTYDRDGKPTSLPQTVAFSLDTLREWAARFRGVIEQDPPPFSAKKVDGVPAYKLARKQKEFTLRRVQVEVKEFEILGLEGQRAGFRARVGSGTYMRSVAHDLGQQAGCGAHLESLRRTTVAEFNLAQAHTLEELEAAARRGSARDLCVSPREILPALPFVTANEETLVRIRSGRSVNLPELSRAKQVKIFDGKRELVAIATRVAGTLFHPKIVLAGEPSVPATKPSKPDQANRGQKEQRDH
ncbi:MAG TPA: tRNA pseudouridine(55) synthase TruB [Terriglobales bacterium]|nr:tRNA pseudouridine(55) synthase TruB [Terriglobales bacterium]